MREDIASLSTWRPVVSKLPIIDAAWAVEDRFGFSWWDALIVAAAQMAGCSHLLTEDLQDGQDLDGVLVVDPFRHLPADILKG